MVDGKPFDARAFDTRGDVVLLVPCHRSHGEALRVVDGSLALAVDYIVDGAVVAPVEQAYIQQVLAEESLVLDLGDAVLAVLAYDDDL